MKWQGNRDKEKERSKESDDSEAPGCMYEGYVWNTKQRTLRLMLVYCKSNADLYVQIM